MSRFVADLSSVSAQIKQAQDILDKLLSEANKEKAKADQAARATRAQQARQASAAQALLAAVRDLADRHKQTESTVYHLLLERDARDADLKQLVLALFEEKEMKDCEMRAEVDGLLVESNQAHQRMEEAVVQFTEAMSRGLEVTAEKPSDARPPEATSLGTPVSSLDSRWQEKQSDPAPQAEPVDDSWVVWEDSLPVKAESSQASSSNEPSKEISRPAEGHSGSTEETGKLAEASGAPIDEPGWLVEELSVDETVAIEPLDLTCGAKFPNKKNHSNKSGSYPSVTLAHVFDEPNFRISVKTSPNSEGDIRLQELERDMAEYYSATPGEGDDFVPEVGCFVAVHSGDSWKRAKISAVDDRRHHAKIHLIDYGPEWQVAFGRLRKLPTKFRALRRQARTVNLSFVNLVSETDARHQAISRLRGLCEGRHLRATVEYSEHSDLHVSLSDPKTTDFSAEINAQLIREGFAYLILGKLKPAHSKTTRTNLRAAEYEYQQSIKAQNAGKMV